MQCKDKYISIKTFLKGGNFLVCSIFKKCSLTMHDNIYDWNIIMFFPRTTVSQDVQTRFPVQLAFAKFLSKIKGNF